MTTRKRVDSWLVTDDFWARVEPLIPVRERLASKVKSVAQGEIWQRTGCIE
jgi:hypothetical protein